MTLLTQSSKDLPQSSPKHGQAFHSSTLLLVPTCPSYGYYCCAKTPWPKWAWEGKGLCGLYFQITIHGRNSSKPKTLWHFPDTDAVEGAVYWLAGLSFLSWFSIDPWNISPEMTPSIMVWALLHQTLRKCPTGLSIAQPYGNSFLTEVPSTQMTSAYVTLT